MLKKQKKEKVIVAYLKSAMKSQNKYFA